MSEFYIPGFDLMKLDLDRFEKRITIGGEVYFRGDQLRGYFSIAKLKKWVTVSDLRRYLGTNKKYEINVSAFMLLVEPHQTIHRLVMKKNIWLTVYWWRSDREKNVVMFHKPFSSNLSAEEKAKLPQVMLQKVVCNNAKFISCLLTVLWRGMWRTGPENNFSMSDDQLNSVLQLLRDARNLLCGQNPEMIIEILKQESFVRGLFLSYQSV